VEAEYMGEPRPEGLVGRLLAPGGGRVQHFDRFLLPCVAQVEYRAGRWLHIVNSVLHLPLGPFRTRAFFVVRAVSERLPNRLVEAVIRLQGPRVARQDVRMLGLQSATIRRFGGEQFSSTDLDLFGTAVWRLLRAAEHGDELPAIAERRVTFRA
jgi:hypothetical protein